MPKRPKKKKNRLDHHARVEHDLEYWLEHVAHWGVLFCVSVLAVASFVVLW